jgi:hypothetical protein
MRTVSRKALSSWFALLTLVVGCGEKLASVQGTITLDGKPIASGENLSGNVTFYPTDGKGVPAVGRIDSNGRYEMATASNVGLPPGSYDVAIVATQIIIPEPGATPSGRPITPRRYASTKDSGLQAQVEPGANTIDFALESQPSS